MIKTIAHMKTRASHFYRSNFGKSTGFCQLLPPVPPEHSSLKALGTVSTSDTVDSASAAPMSIVAKKLFYLNINLFFTYLGKLINSIFFVLSPNSTSSIQYLEYISSNRLQNMF